MHKFYIKIFLILFLFSCLNFQETSVCASENAGVAPSDVSGVDVKTINNSSILGSTSDPDSVAWLLQQILNYIRALGPAIVVVLSGVEFAKVIVTGDDDGMKKAQKKLITRLILVALLFFVPTITLAILDIFGMSSNDPTCGLE